MLSSSSSLIRTCGVELIPDVDVFVRLDFIVFWNLFLSEWRLLPDPTEASSLWGLDFEEFLPLSVLFATVLLSAFRCLDSELNTPLHLIRSLHAVSGLIDRRIQSGILGIGLSVVLLLPPGLESELLLLLPVDARRTFEVALRCDLSNSCSRVLMRRTAS